MRIQYTSNVRVDAGWRSITIIAQATPNASKKMAVVDSVETIDGETPNFGMSRTGAKRQSYNGKYISNREIGMKKRLSACIIV